ncbi:MAG: PQQ-dependent sugar dehydrogenase [Bdellovibrionales bacterium]
MKSFFSFVVCLCVIAVMARAEDTPVRDGNLRVTTVAKGLEHPWSLEFLPDGRMLVTERPGRMRIVSGDGKLSQPLSGVPEVYAEGQGGLLDVALDPQFEKNHIIYFSFAEEKGGAAGTAVAKAKLEKTGLQDVQIIFRQQPKVKGKNHWGSRVVVDGKNMLFITLGERFDYRDKAQDMSTHFGKVVRIHTDGSAPKDNPFAAQKDALPEIWSYGHRNIQGAAMNPATGELWTAEHGPRGGDEINIDRAGKNYGWPKASYGSHYSGEAIPDQHAGQGFEEPVFHWNPSISPSGMMFYTGDRFPAWNGDLFVGALNGMALIRLDIENGKSAREERLLQKMEERIRDVKQGPDGLIYILTDNENGRILRVEPE